MERSLTAGSSCDLAFAVRQYLSLLRTRNPDLSRLAKKGVSPDKIEKLEQKFEVQLPDVLREYLSLLNGQRGTKKGIVSWFDGKYEISLGDIDCVFSWRNNQIGQRDYCPVDDFDFSCESAVRRLFWSDSWFPIGVVAEDCSKILFLDFDPSSTGVLGQVVLQEVSSADARILERRVIAESLVEFFLAASRGLVSLVEMNRGKDNSARQLDISYPYELIMSRFSDLLREIEIIRGVREAPKKQVSDRASAFGFPDNLLEFLETFGGAHFNLPKYGSIFILQVYESISASQCPDNEGDEILVSLSKSSAVKSFFYSDRRFVLAWCDYFTFLYDNDPTDVGSMGQIIVVDNEGEEVDLFSPSLKGFVMMAIDALVEEQQQHKDNNNNK